MNKITRYISLIVTPLPYGMWRAYRHYFFVSVCYAALATAYITSNQKRFVVISYVLSIVLFVMGTRKKRRIIDTGCIAVVLRVCDYTYLRKRMVKKEKPTGVLLTPLDDEGFGKKYHLALRPDNIPEIGSAVRIFLPADIEVKSCGDRFYFPIVYDYVEEQMG